MEFKCCSRGYLIVIPKDGDKALIYTLTKRPRYKLFNPLKVLRETYIRDFINEGCIMYKEIPVSRLPKDEYITLKVNLKELKELLNEINQDFSNFSNLTNKVLCESYNKLVELYNKEVNNI